MTKKWETIECNFDHKTFVEVSFINSESDFRTTRYPNINEATYWQIDKLERDVKAFVGAGKDIKKIIDFLLA